MRIIKDDLVILSSLSLCVRIQVENPKWGFAFIKANDCIAVNAWWQSTASADGPRQRRVSAPHKTSLVKALYDFIGSVDHAATAAGPVDARAAVAASAEEFPMPFTARVWQIAFEGECPFLPFDAQLQACAVSKYFFELMSAEAKKILMFERAVMQFAWSRQASSLLQMVGLRTSEKVMLVAAMYEFLERSRNKRAPEDWEDCAPHWALVTMYVAASCAALSVDSTGWMNAALSSPSTEMVHKVIMESQVGQEAKLLFMKSKATLLNRYGSTH